MSRIGRKPITLPEVVEVNVDAKNVVTVKGPKGQLQEQIHKDMSIEIEANELLVKRPTDNKMHRSLHGLSRTLIDNMVIGVIKGYEKKLKVVGVGYRVQKQGTKMTLNLGYSHPIEMEDPEGIETEVTGQNDIIIRGINKQQVGNYAAKIREKRQPEPYKGKGIKYADEVILRKEGKTAK